MSERHQIMREFVRGYCFGLDSSLEQPIHPSQHWLAGWQAGYKERPHKNAALDRYLESIGQERQAVIEIVVAKNEAVMEASGDE